MNFPSTSLKLPRFFTPSSMVRKNLVVGPLSTPKEGYGETFRMAWPSMMETVLVSMISFVDMLMVSSVGEDAIAAVGITNQPKFILLAVFMALNVGVTAVVARRRGEENRDGANRCLKQSLVIVSVLSILVSVLGIAFARPFMIFAGAQGNVVDLSVTFFRLVVIALFFNCVSLTINAAQRGAGNTKISMRSNLTANIVNIIFNFLLIGGHLGFPKLGIAGSGIATAIGNFTGFLMSVYSVSKPGNFLHITLENWFSFDRKTLTALFSISGSAAVEQVFMRIGFFSYAIIVAKLGTVDFATHQICMSIINFSFSFGDGLGIAASSLVGRNLGAKRPDLSIIYGKVAQRMALMISCAISLVFIFGGGFLVSLFSDDPHIISLGHYIMYIMAVITLAQTSQVVFSGCLRGAGDTFYVAIVSMISITIVRPLISWALCYPAGLGLFGAWIGFLADQYLRLGFTLIRFSSGKWCSIKI